MRVRREEQKPYYPTTELLIPQPPTPKYPVDAGPKVFGTEPPVPTPETHHRYARDTFLVLNSKTLIWITTRRSVCTTNNTKLFTSDASDGSTPNTPNATCFTAIYAACFAAIYAASFAAIYATYNATTWTHNTSAWTYNTTIRTNNTSNGTIYSTSTTT